MMPTARYRLMVIKLFYDTAYDGAKISSLMDAGFNYQFSGVRMATSLTGAGSYQKLQ